MRGFGPRCRGFESCSAHRISSGVHLPDGVGRTVVTSPQPNLSVRMKCLLSDSALVLTDSLHEWRRRDLRADPENSLHAHNVVEQLARGEAATVVTGKLGVAQSTLANILNACESCISTMKPITADSVSPSANPHHCLNSMPLPRSVTFSSNVLRILKNGSARSLIHAKPESSTVGTS